MKTPNQQFNTEGYAIIRSLLTAEEINKLRIIYEDFLSGKIETQGHRSDLSGKTGSENTKAEKIIQIMRPSDLYPPLQNLAVYQKALSAVQDLLGGDMGLDFDMLIDKPPFTDTITPWHQDEAYWIDMEDKRSATCWIALDPVDEHNGCMWFVPGSNQKALRTHIQTNNSGALACEASETEAKAIALNAGDCTFHHGRTIHYSRGNSTDRRRRAFILNYRPQTMIAFERAQGFDHLGKRAVRQ